MSEFIRNMRVYFVPCLLHPRYIRNKVNRNYFKINLFPGPIFVDYTLCAFRAIFSSGDLIHF